MRYKAEDYIEECLELIKKENLIFAKDLIGLLPFTEPTFYKMYPPESDMYEQIKSAIEKNKINLKVRIRRKLMQSDKAGELLALYRLICTPEERLMLNQSYIDITTKGKSVDSLQTTTIHYEVLPPEGETSKEDDDE